MGAVLATEENDRRSITLKEASVNGDYHDFSQSPLKEKAMKTEITPR